MQFLKKDLTSSQDLSAGALSYTSSSSNRIWKLEEVTLKFSVAVTETVTITRDSAQGTTYDHVLRTLNLTGATSCVFRPEGECNFNAGDEVKVQCTNANLTGIAYLTIKRSELP